MSLGHLVGSQAETDELTGLANRRAPVRMLTAALMRAEAHEHVVGVLMLDLDGFKAVNDRHGHAAGAAALREVAARLRRSVRERDMVARTGGDEFVVALPDLATDASAAHEAAARRPGPPYTGRRAAVWPLLRPATARQISSTIIVPMMAPMIPPRSNLSSSPIPRTFVKMK